LQRQNEEKSFCFEEEGKKKATKKNKKNLHKKKSTGLGIQKANASDAANKQL
jgi:hypothetical protein